LKADRAAFGSRRITQPLRHARHDPIYALIGPSSITPRERELLGMKISVPEELLTDTGAFHEKADVELIGHAHATMHLHTLLHREDRGRAGARLTDRHRRSRIGEVCIELLERLQYRRAGDLDIDIELRGTMLKRPCVRTPPHSGQPFRTLRRRARC
jgi:hypothetical protein